MSDTIQDAGILTSITQYFGTNNENEIPDDSSTWVTSGIFYDYEYVWQRTSTTYDDNTTLNTNPILTNNSNKVVSVSYQYFGTNDEEKVPTNNDTWYDDQPVGSSFVWRRTDTEFEDGSHVYGNIELIESGDSEDDGESSTDTGELAPSIEIVSVANQYYGTDNQSYTPDGSETWSEVTPEQYRYLWVRTKTTYSDGTIEYSTPQLDISDDEWSEEGDDVPAPPADEEGSYVPDESPDTEGIPDDMDMIIEEGEKTDPVEAQVISDWVGVQQELFDKLTGKGQNEGIFYWGEEDEQGHRDLFINASFIRTGVLQLGGSNNDYGVLQLLNQNNDVIGQWDKTGINVNNGVFRVTDTGALTATSATITGVIKANSGTIGNNATNKITIGTNATNASIYSGMSSLGNTTNEGFYIGTDGIALGKGAFKVTKAGALTATSATITGVIKANSGTIGNNATNKITIGTNATNASIYSGMSSLGNTSNNGFYIGTDGIALGKGAFKVTSAGALTATSATITGSIKATSLTAEAYIKVDGNKNSLFRVPISSKDNRYLQLSSTGFVVRYGDNCFAADDGHGVYIAPFSNFGKTGDLTGFSTMFAGTHIRIHQNGTTSNRCNLNYNALVFTKSGESSNASVYGIESATIKGPLFMHGDVKFKSSTFSVTTVSISLGTINKVSNVSGTYNIPASSIDTNTYQVIALEGWSLNNAFLIPNQLYITGTVEKPQIVYKIVNWNASNNIDDCTLTVRVMKITRNSRA